MSNSITLVLGDNGFIGRHLTAELKKRGQQVVGARYPEFDITKNLWPFRFTPAQVGTVYVCVQRGGIDECTKHPAETRAVNVTGIQHFLEHFKNTPAVPVYLSSSMAFAGDKDDRRETEQPDPQTEYGRQKYEMEQWLQGNFANALIVRLTKVYGVDREDGTLFTAWLDKLQAEQKMQVATDSFIAPVFVGDVVRALADLVAAKQSGIFHLAGSEKASIADFALEAARFFDMNEALIENKSIADFGFLEPRSRWNTLNTKKVKEALNFSPIPINQTLSLIAKNYGRN